MVIIILPLIVFAICLVGTLFITSKYEHKFAYPIKEILVDLIGKSHAFHIPEEPVPAEHRDELLYYKIEFSEIFNKGLQMELSRLMANLIKRSGVTFDRLIGVECKKGKEQPIREKYSVVPILSAIMKKPYAVIVEIVDEHSKQFVCEGEVQEGETVIIIDDILTTGKSIIAATEYLHKNFKNIEVAHAFAFAVRYPYDQGGLEGARKKLADHGIQFHTIIDNVTLVDGLYERKYITLGQLKQVSRDVDLAKSPVLERFKD